MTVGGILEDAPSSCSSWSLGTFPIDCFLLYIYLFPSRFKFPFFLFFNASIVFSVSLPSSSVIRSSLPYPLTMNLSELISVISLVFTIIGAIGGLSSLILSLWPRRAWFREQFSRFWPRNRETPPTQPSPPTDSRDAPRDSGHRNSEKDRPELADVTVQRQIGEVLRSILRDEGILAGETESTPVQNVSVGQEDPASVVEDEFTANSDHQTQVS